MNESNILANVPVPRVEDGSFQNMYLIQIELQRRLDQLPIDSTDHKHAAQKCVYWGHCIRAEIVELTEWLVRIGEPTALKELQMEAIDIIHFVFNMGIELGYTAEDIATIEGEYDQQGWPLDNQRINAATSILETCVIKLIDQLPWKTWKKYKVAADLEAVYIAYVNVLRATLLLCNACGLYHQDMIDMYYAKNKVNHARQDGGY